MMMKINLDILILTAFLGCVGSADDFAGNPVGSFYRWWSGWSAWSSCGRTCGTGVQARTRLCKGRSGTSKTEKKFCFGETMEYRICNIHNCPPDSVDFRQFQCSLYNNRLVAQRLIHEWIPYNENENECELRCQSKNKDMQYSFGKVMDGTKCSHKTQSLCVNGRCLPVDCNGKISSKIQMDACEICKDDNKTCIHYKNIYSNQSVQSNYHQTSVNLPNATKMKIHHLDWTDNLARHTFGAPHELKCLTVSVSHLNKYIIYNPRIDNYAAQYSKINSWAQHKYLLKNEKVIHIWGPTNRNCYITVLLRSIDDNLYYEYWLSEWQDTTGIMILEKVLHRMKLTESLPIWNEEKFLAYHQYLIEDQFIKMQNKGMKESRNDRNLEYNSRVIEKSGCKSCTKVKNLIKNFCQSIFVLRAIVTETVKINGKIRYQLEVIESFKNQLLIQSKEYLWTTKICQCPRLRHHREYLIMGRLKIIQRESYLWIDRKSYVRRYNPRRAKLLLKLTQNKTFLVRFCGQRNS